MPAMKSIVSARVSFQLLRMVRLTTIARERDELKGTLEIIGGSKSDHWNETLYNQATQALWLHYSDSKERNRQMNATVAALVGIGPKDEL